MLAGFRTYPSMPPTGNTRCRANQSNQSRFNRWQSQGPPSCPNSQLMYWQPKGLPVLPITPALHLGRTPTSATPLQDMLLGDAGSPNPLGISVEVAECHGSTGPWVRVLMFRGL